MKFGLFGPLVSEEKMFENVEIQHTYIYTHIHTYGSESDMFTGDTSERQSFTRTNGRQRLSYTIS